MSRTTQEIKQAVRRHYGALVQSEANRECGCCGPQPATGTLVKLAGYDPDQLASLPTDSVEKSFGCGNPVHFAEVKEGQTVLDIGSGAGIDCLLAAERVGPTGRVFGLDMTPEMIARARRNIAESGWRNIEILEGEAEEIPLEDGTVDWVFSNCVLNLSPDKQRVFAEIARVLKPGGQISISDVVLGRELPPQVRQDLNLWAGCVGGALPESEYLKGLTEAGLHEVKVENRFVYERATLGALLSGCCEGDPIPDHLAEQFSDWDGQVWSGLFRGRKASPAE